MPLGNATGKLTTGAVWWFLPSTLALAAITLTAAKVNNMAAIITEDTWGMVIPYGLNIRLIPGSLKNRADCAKNL